MTQGEPTSGAQSLLLSDDTEQHSCSQFEHKRHKDTGREWLRLAAMKNEPTVLRFLFPFLRRRSNPPSRRLVIDA